MATVVKTPEERFFDQPTCLQIGREVRANNAFETIAQQSKIVPEECDARYCSALK